MYVIEKMPHLTREELRDRLHIRIKAKKENRGPKTKVRANNIEECQQLFQERQKGIELVRKFLDAKQ